MKSIGYCSNESLAKMIYGNNSEESIKKVEDLRQEFFKNQEPISEFLSRFRGVRNINKGK